jgi:hypothetical protein
MGIRRCVGREKKLQIPPLRFAALGMTKGSVSGKSETDELPDRLRHRKVLKQANLCHPDRSVPGFPAALP